MRLQGDAARSADINLAYRTLTDGGERARYDSELRRNGPPPTAARYEFTYTMGYIFCTLCSLM